VEEVRDTLLLGGGRKERHLVRIFQDSPARPSGKCMKVRTLEQLEAVA
jgi:hypothetical protein